MPKARMPVKKRFSRRSKKNCPLSMPTYANDFQELAEYYTGATLYTEDDLWEILDDALHYGYLVGYGDRAQGNDCYYTERLFDYYPEYEDHFDHNMDDIKNALHN